MIPQILPDWQCHCGAGLDEACDQLTAHCDITSELVIRRLEEAGSTLLAMRTRSPYPLPPGSCMPEAVHSAIEAYGWSETENRCSPPPSRAIDRMDKTFGWLALIPSHRHVLRRIVAVRTLVDPVTGRHLVHWQRVAKIIRADYRAAKRWHAAGISIIVERLAHD